MRILSRELSSRFCALKSRAQWGKACRYQRFGSEKYAEICDQSIKRTLFITAHACLLCVCCPMLCYDVDVMI